MTRRPRSQPAPASTPRTGWTHAQRKLAVIACSSAGWNDAQRYIVMRHCGCPLSEGTNRPSVNHPRNTGQQLRLLMSFAEGPARANGKPLRPPRNQPSWEAAVRDRAADARHLARRIVSEAIDRAPRVFDAGLEAFVVDHVWRLDQDDQLGAFLEHRPESFEQCDAPTMIRVIECLRAFVGRKLLGAGIEPQSFRPPPSARRRVAPPSPSPGGPARPAGSSPSPSPSPGGPARRAGSSPSPSSPSPSSP